MAVAMAMAMAMESSNDQKRRIMKLVNMMKRRVGSRTCIWCSSVPAAVGE